MREKDCKFKIKGWRKLWINIKMPCWTRLWKETILDLNKWELSPGSLKDPPMKTWRDPKSVKWIQNHSKSPSTPTLFTKKIMPPQKQRQLQPFTHQFPQEDSPQIDQQGPPTSAIQPIILGNLTVAEWVTIGLWAHTVEFGKFDRMICE